MRTRRRTAMPAFGVGMLVRDRLAAGGASALWQLIVPGVTFALFALAGIALARRADLVELYEITAAKLVGKLLPRRRSRVI